MPNSIRLFSVLIMIAISLPTIADAQNIGGGTPDMQRGAAGANQPSSNSGQRAIPAQPSADAEEEAVPQAPPPAPKKKKKPAPRKPKPAAAATAPN